MPTFSAQVSNDGKQVNFDSPEMWAEARGKLKGKRVQITLERENARRSNPQNRRFWGITVPVCREILNQKLEARGCPVIMTKEQTHHYLEEWFGLKMKTPIGTITKTCSEYSVPEFMAFIDNIEGHFRRVEGAVFPDDEEMVREAM